MKAEEVIGRIVGWSAWHFLDPSQIKEDQSRHSRKTVWCRILDINFGNGSFKARCIHTGHIRYGSLPEVHTIMPEGYSHA